MEDETVNLEGMPPDYAGKAYAKIDVMRAINGELLAACRYALSVFEQKQLTNGFEDDAIKKLRAAIQIAEVNWPPTPTHPGREPGAMED